MQRIRDAWLEVRIWWAKRKALAWGAHLMARKIWRRHVALIGQRSAGQVDRMETRMGLR